MEHRKVYGFDVVFGILILFVIVIFLGVNPGESMEAKGEMQGKTITVDDDGEADYPRIQWAIDNATAGDTIRVFDGNYSEALSIHQQSLSIIGNGSSKTTLYPDPDPEPYFERLNVGIYSDGVTLQGFTIMGSDKRDHLNLQLVDVDDCSISENKFSGDKDAIELHSCHNITIRDNAFSENQVAIYVHETEDLMVQANLFSVREDSSTCISISQSHHITIMDNQFESSKSLSNKGEGLKAYKSSYVNISDNNFSSMKTGVQLSSSSNCSLTSNSLQSQNYGVIIADSTHMRLRSNNFSNTAINLHGFELEFWDSHDIDDSNTVNGQPIHYIKNLTDGEYSDLQGPVILVNCHGLRFRNLECSNGTTGFLAVFSSNIEITGGTFISNTIAGVHFTQTLGDERSRSVIRDSFFQHNGDGIYLEEVPFTCIENCTIIGNTNGINVYSNSTIISYTNCSDNTNDGILIYGHGTNSLESNICNDNGNNGIKLAFSSHNQILNTSASANSESGIIIESSYYNMLMNNTLLNNDIGLDLEGYPLQTTVINCTIYHNDIGISIGQASFGHVIRNNAIVSNKEYGIKAPGNPVEDIVVTNNWWGHHTGPYDPIDNPNGRGDAVVSSLHYRPWLKSWHDSSFYIHPEDEPTADGGDDDGDDDNQSGFMLFILLLLLTLLLVVLILVNGSTFEPKTVQTRTTMQSSASKIKQHEQTFPSSTPLPGPRESACLHCSKIIVIDPYHPAIHIHCPHCGEFSLNEQFR